MGVTHERHNNFDFLRFLGAVLVIWGHAYAIAKVPAPALWGRGVHSIGIVLFFCISGFLVAESLKRSPTLGEFFRKRALRIFPGLFVCVLVSALVLGPLISRLSAPDYFSHPLFWTYLQTLALRIRYFLPGVFEANPHPAINGSLWSLPVEFGCYVAIAAIGRVLTIRWFPLSLSAAFVIAIGTRVWISAADVDAVLYGVSIKSASSVVPFFFAGALLNEFKSRLPWRIDLVVLLVTVMFLVSSIASGPLVQAFSYFAIPYIVLGVALSPLPTIADWGQRWHGDLSYGMYLYGAPIQQLILSVYSGDAPRGVVLIGGLLGAATCAAASWRFVEAPALRLKHRFRTSPNVERTNPLPHVVQPS